MAPPVETPTLLELENQVKRAWEAPGKVRRVYLARRGERPEAASASIRPTNERRDSEGGGSVIRCETL
jgi:hypothetical protein